MYLAGESLSESLCKQPVEFHRRKQRRKTLKLVSLDDGRAFGRNESRGMVSVTQITRPPAFLGEKTNIRLTYLPIPPLISVEVRRL